MPPVLAEEDTRQPASTRLFVSNLPPSCTSEQLKNHFHRMPGASGCLLTDAQVIHKQGFGSSSRCIGFVGFSTSNDATTARKYFNGSYLSSCRLNVTLARDSKQRRTTSSPFSLHSSTAASIPDAKDAKLSRRTQILKSDLEDALAPRRGGAHAWSNDDGVKAPAVNQSAKRKSKKIMASAPQEKDGEESSTAKQEKRPKMSRLQESDDGDLQWLREKSLSSRRLSQQQVGEKRSEPSEEISQSSLEHDDRAGKDNIRVADTNSMEEKKNKSGVEADFSEARLYVKNIPFSCGHDDLKDVLSPYGRVTELHVPKNDRGEDGGGNRGYAFAQFSSTVEACAAAEALNGFTFQVWCVRACVLF